MIFHVRQVSKVLSPNSLIAKIWLAWGEEQQNVLFTVKRIKTERREAGQEGGTASQPSCSLARNVRDPENLSRDEIPKRLLVNNPWTRFIQGKILANVFRIKFKLRF